jgi:hypothetical protein
MHIRGKDFAAHLALFATLAVMGSATSQVTTQPAVSAASATTPARFDFNGYWGVGGPDFSALLGGPPKGNDLAISAPLRNGDISNLTNDGVLLRRATNNLPKYKPEHWDKVLELDYEGNLLDPFNSCMPMSVPRMGAPRRIIVLPNFRSAHPPRPA